MVRTTGIESVTMQERADLVCSMSEVEEKDWSIKLQRLLEEGRSKSTNRNELADLFCQPQMKGLLGAFQRLLFIKDSNTSTCSNLPSVPHEVDDDDGLAIKVVRLVKNTAEPLGATIKEYNGRLLIARILRGGVADRCGCIGSGDQVVEVNGISVLGKKPTDVVRLLNSSNGSVIFKLIPALELSPSACSSAAFTNIRNDDNASIYLRSMFTYHPSDDFLNPCPEASLTFHSGDILHVLDSSDNNWWQAKIVRTNNHLQSNDHRVGLIPSPSHLKSFASKLTPNNGNGFAVSSDMQQSDCHYQQTCRGRHRRRIEIQHCAMDACISYEQMVLYCMPTGTYRPVVLIGPTGVGRTELKRKLIAEDCSKYRTTVPYTSRPSKPGELDGVHYHFISRAQMEQLIRQGGLVEYGEYKGNLYGTTVDSVRQLIEQGYVCILNPHPQAIRHLRKAELKPFFIYVRPPPFPTLKATRIKENSKSRMTVDQLEQMIEQSKSLESSFGHYFDHVLVNGNLDVAVRELLDIVSLSIEEAQWMPASWL